MDIFSIEATFPPSLEKMPLIAMATVYAFLVMVLICMRWLYEIVVAKRKMPAPAGSYIAVARQVRFWLVWAGMLASAPRLVQLMLWQALGSDNREILSAFTWVSIIACAFMVARAWVLDRRAVATEVLFSQRHEHVMLAVTDRSEKLQVRKILAVVAVIAFATTFVRPATNVSVQSDIAVRP